MQLITNSFLFVLVFDVVALAAIWLSGRLGYLTTGGRRNLSGPGRF